MDKLDCAGGERPAQPKLEAPTLVLEALDTRMSCRQSDYSGLGAVRRPVGVHGEPGDVSVSPECTRSLYFPVKKPLWTGSV